jgi:hypothetical protein
VGSEPAVSQACSSREEEEGEEEEEEEEGLGFRV